MSTDNISQENSEALSLVEKVVEQFEAKKAKERAEAEALQNKLNKADKLEEQERHYKETSEKLLKESEELLGGKNIIRTFKNNSGIDELTIASLINGLKGDYTGDQMKEYFNQLDPNKYDVDKYQDSSGFIKFTKDLTRDIDKFLLSKQADQTQESETKQNEKKIGSKIDNNAQPEKVSTGNFVPQNPQGHRAREATAVKEANRLLKGIWD